MATLRVISSAPLSVGMEDAARGENVIESALADADTSRAAAVIAVEAITRFNIMKSLSIKWFDAGNYVAVLFRNDQGLNKQVFVSRAITF